MWKRKAWVRIAEIDIDTGRREASSEHDEKHSLKSYPKWTWPYYLLKKLWS
jgi:hypothetical protein